MVRRKSAAACIRGKREGGSKGRKDRRSGGRPRALIQPEKDPASKFTESSHDFSRSGTENAGEREIRALVESGRGTTFHIDRVPSSLAPFDQALGSNTTLCPIKPMGAGVASVHVSGEGEATKYQSLI